MQQKKVVRSPSLFSHLSFCLSNLRRIFVFLILILCFNAFSFAAAVWSGNMGTDSYKNTTESYMTGDTSFDKLTIYCGSTYFTVDLCGYNLNSYF